MPRDEAVSLVETNLGSILGTVRYMSPEQACGAQVDKSTDIWSLGVVLYEMVTGHAPFTGDTPQDVMFSILEKEPRPLTRYIAPAPAELQQTISKTLRKDREERYHSAQELLESLKGLRHKLEVEAELQPSTAAPPWLRWIRSPTAVVLVLLVAALALALPFYLASEPDDQLTTGQKHRRASIPRSEPDKGPGIFLRRYKRGDPRRSQRSMGCVSLPAPRHFHSKGRA